jgi:WD40 repeat protein
VEHWGALLLILKGHSDVINAVQLSRDGSKLASASYDKKVMVWYLNRISRMETFIVERYVEDLAFSADEFHLKTSIGSFKLKSTVGLLHGDNACSSISKLCRTGSFSMDTGRSDFTESSALAHVSRLSLGSRLLDHLSGTISFWQTSALRVNVFIS